jgi:tetratricopeptide (TPR) repeat protein
MRKQLLWTIVAGMSIGIVLAMLITAAVRREPAASAVETTLLEPVKRSPGVGIADRNISAAQSIIKSRPEVPEGFNLLAAAFMQKARETGDFSYNARAEEAIRQSFKVAPNNVDGKKLNAALLLNFHKFSEALAEARGAQAINPRDHEVYGSIVDALVELGDYKGAVDAAQTMVDLRPDTASYSRISYLRFLHGDSEGAIEAMKMAAQAANPKDAENSAWCRAQLGDELLNIGRTAEAEREIDHALHLFPGYHLALAAKARARAAAGDVDQAIGYYKQAVERVPLPEYVVALGNLYAKAGRTAEAKQQYEQLEFIESTAAVGGTYSRQLALFWADQDINLDEALAVAQREFSVRKDIYASDLLAWCLFKKGRIDEAKAAIAEAMRLGTKDPRLFYHAGMIHMAGGNKKDGKKYLQTALQINPSFDLLQADLIRQKLKG